MAPTDPSPRHIGRVIDPAAREDGDVDAEPIVELAPERTVSDAGGTSTVSDPEHELVRGERLRQRLLARAENARRDRESPHGSAARDDEVEPGTQAIAAETAETAETSEADPAPTPNQAAEKSGAVRPALDQATHPPSYGDLDEIGRTSSDDTSPPKRGPRPPLAIATGSLSPTWIAIFGTLLGVGAVVSLLALAINVDPRTASAPLSRQSAAPPPPAPSAALAPEVPEPKRARTRLPGPWRVADAKDAATTRIIEGKVGTNSFLKALEAAGVPLKEGYRVLTAMKGVRNFDRCSASDRFVALVDRSSSRLRAFEYQVAPEEVYQAREDAAGLLRGSKLDLKVERSQVVGALTLKGKSFDDAAELAGFEGGLSRVVAKALDGHLALDELEFGDRLRIVAQEMTVLGEFGRYTGIEAIEVKRADETRAPLRVYYLDLGGDRGYYDAEGNSPFEGGWRKPIKDAPMSSPFNLKRLHPVLKKTMPHLGMDLAAPTGTPVGAATFGTVTFVGNGGPSGNLVKIMHANEVETGYAHLSRFAEGIRVGDKVKRLQVIGYVGSTGRSTGPHLHFSASKKGAFFDPATLNLDSMRSLPKANRERFFELKRKYDAQLDRIPLPPPATPPPPLASPPPPTSNVALAVPDAEPGVGGDTEDPNDSDAGGSRPMPAVDSPPKPSIGAAAPTPQGNRSAVHLTDKELLELQAASDDGEVEP